jgi:hypothetical protein
MIIKSMVWLGYLWVDHIFREEWRSWLSTVGTNRENLSISTTIKPIDGQNGSWTQIHLSKQSFSWAIFVDFTITTV